MNQFTYSGRIYDLEQKTTKAGKPFCTFNLVQTEKAYKSNEERFIVLKMSAFGENAVTILSVGPEALVNVSGKIDSREWQGKHYPDFRIINVGVVDENDPQA